MAQQFVFELYVTGLETERAFRLPVGRIIIGRQAGNTLPLDHPLVSRQHAQLECTADSCQITDLGSANGTLLNGEKLTPHAPVQLPPQAIIQIGPFQLAYKQVAVETKELTAKPELPPPAAVKPPDSPPPPPPPPSRRPPPPPERPSAKPFMLPGLNGRSQRYLSYLPGIYHTDFMARFLALFESILTPIEWNVDNFDLFLSPKTAPVGFLPWLATWFELTFDDSWDEKQRRTLLAEAYQIYGRRGTKLALSRVLEIYTGYPPEIIDLDKDLDPFIFTVKIPLPKSQVNRSLIERLIDAHKPAYTSYKLLFQ